MTDVLNVHFTEVQEALRCWRKWYNSNYHQLEPLEKGNAMLFGSAFHRLKEGYLKDEQLAFDPPPHDADLVPKLFEVWKTWYQGQGYVHHQIEQSLTVPLHDVLFTVTPDGLLEDSNGEMWLDETKTTASFDEDRLYLDLQGRTQMLVAKELGHDVAGVKYTQVRKSNPATARVDIIKEFSIRFPDGALEDAAITIEQMLGKIVMYRKGLDADQVIIERAMLRNPNPISFMDCACDFAEACIASFNGLEQAYLAENYKTKEPR